MGEMIGHIALCQKYRHAVVFMCVTQQKQDKYLIYNKDMRQRMKQKPPGVV
jgi:hypothetical protein